MAVQQKLFLLLTILATTIASKPAPNCSHPQVCGSLTIPYPFGTTPDCYLNEKFFISCDQTHSPPKPLLSRSNVTVLNISLDGELRVLGPIARSCYDKYGQMTTNKTRIFSMINNSNFPISTRNKFTAVGCDTIGLIKFAKGRANTTTGCVSYCDQETREVVNGSCSGVGCCQMPIIQEIWNYETKVQSVTNHSKIHDVNPCDYAFVVEEGSYNFSSLDLKDNLKNKQSVPVLLDWAIVDKTCEKAKENVNTYACQANNGQCVNSTNGHGYRCHCEHGYQGNPYLVDGCQDVNECETTKPCSKICKNKEGGYECSCPLGYKGDGEKTGTGCTPTYVILFAVSFGLLILVVGFCWIYWGMKKRKLIKLKEKFFKQNGGLLLQQQLRRLKAESMETARIFTIEELKKATNNYDKNRVLGQGGHGTVYKGILPDNKVVAIKKSKIAGDLTEIEQFVNEITLLSNINHRNIVKLLGCCLETEVPVLVYEFITNGTLSQHIHDRAISHQSSSLSFEMRLKIAIETAGALAYLHSSASIPIIHRDIKTSNILLDENYTAKVSDFGASRLVPIDHCQLTTLVQGTFGYLDPEYMKLGRFTEKSDVYSFGVVLAELLTSKKAISFERLESYRNLANWFVCSLREGQLLQIVDDRVVGEENIEEVSVVAKIAEMCLRTEGKERPQMKEVAIELEGIVKNKNKHLLKEDHDSIDNSRDIEYLLKHSSRFDSVENQLLVAYGGR